MNKYLYKFFSFQFSFFIQKGHQSNQVNQFANLALKKPPSFRNNFSFFIRI